MLDRPSSPNEGASDQVLRWPTRRSREWTEAFLRSARSNANITAVVAIGSGVRHDVPSADVDLVVICKDPHVFNAAAPMEVDLRTYSRVEVDVQLKSGNDMLGWAVRFGRVLFQRDCFWDEVVRSWRHRLPLPSSKLARERAAAAFRHLTNVFKAGDADAAHEQALSYLTHLARAELLDRGVYPASRPELAEQLRGIGSARLAEWLDRLLHGGSSGLSEIDALLNEERIRVARQPRQNPGSN